MNDLLYKRDKTKEDIEQLLYENKNLVYNSKFACHNVVKERRV